MNDEYVCPFCGKVFSRQRSLTFHKNRCPLNPDQELVLVNRNKMSESAKLACSKPEVKEHRSKAQKNHTVSIETRQKIRESHLGRPMSDEAKANMSKGHKGKKHTELQRKNHLIAMQREDTRQKISDAGKGRVVSDDTKLKLSISNSGQKRSEEAKRKMREAQARPEVKEKIKISNSKLEVKAKRSESTKLAQARPEVKEKISKSLKIILNKPEVRQKVYNTKKQNNSFHTSKIEEQLKDYFNSNNIEYITQYKSEVYPFSCDFYFPQKDLYVEIQGSWTHGDKPYIKDDSECIEQLERWKAKNTKYYDNAIETWTVRDIKKRETAKINKLNWIEIFSDKFNICITEILRLLDLLYI